MNSNSLTSVYRTTLTAKEAAEYLGVSYWFITQLVKRRQIPCIRLGNRLLFRVQTLQEHMQQQEINSIRVLEEPDERIGVLRRIKE